MRIVLGLALCTFFTFTTSMTVDEGKIKTMLELSKHHWTLEEKIEKINGKIIKHNPQNLSLIQEHPARAILCKIKYNNAMLWFAILNPKKFNENFFSEKKEVSLKLLREAEIHMIGYEAEANIILEKASKHRSRL